MFSKTPDSAPGWRQVLPLCLPALLIGAWLRISFLMMVPEAYFGSDSSSYFWTSERLYTQGKLTMPERRRWLYPLFMVAMRPLPGTIAQSTAAVQHAAGLILVVGIGWITAHATRHWRIWVPIVTCLVAVWPRMLWYEHEVVAESFFVLGCVWAIAMAFPRQKILSEKKLFWLLLIAGAVAALKPHGRLFWVTLLGVAVFHAWPPWKWSRRILVTLAVSIGLILSSGEKEQGAWLLLSSTLPLVNPDGETHREYRQVLRPLIEEARSVPAWKYGYIQRLYKGYLKAKSPDRKPGPEWKKLRDSPDFSAHATALAREGILQHPLAFLQITLGKLLVTMSDNGTKHVVPTDNASRRTVAPSFFWDLQDETVLEFYSRKPAGVALFFDANEAGYRELSAQRRGRADWITGPLLRFNEWFRWAIRTGEAKDPNVSSRLSWIGILSAAGIFLTLLRPWRSLLWFVVLPCGFYLLSVFAVADAVSRYLLPVEWAGYLMAAVSLDAVLCGFQWLWKSVRAPKNELISGIGNPTNGG
jgi:hypothetical protein